MKTPKYCKVCGAKIPLIRIKSHRELLCKKHYVEKHYERNRKYIKYKRLIEGMKHVHKPKKVQRISITRAKELIVEAQAKETNVLFILEKRGEETEE